MANDKEAGKRLRAEITELALENIRLKKEIDRDGEIIDALVEACGPAGDDVLEMIKDDLDGET